MSSKSALQAQLLQHVKTGRDIAAKAEAEGRDLNPEEMASITKSVEDALAVKKSIADLDNVLAGDTETLKNLNALGLEYGVLAQTATNDFGQGKSLGERFMGAERMKSWFDSMQVAKGGHLSRDVKVHSPSIQFGSMKDILAAGGGNTGVGNLVDSDRRGLIDDGSDLFRELTIRDLVSKGTTESDLIEFVKVTGFTNNAAPVPEAQGVQPYVSGAGQVEGAKPQSSMVLEQDDTKVITIAHWIPVTKRSLSDAARIRSLIDNFLRYGLEEELEDQMLTGSGSGENFTGLLNTSGTGTQLFESDLLTTTRKAKTKVKREGKGRATAYVFNPADNERIDLLQNGNGDFYFGAPQGNQIQTLWGIPRIESEAMPEGTGMVADWRYAELIDREQAGIQLSDSHLDFFTRNLVAILAELRAAFVCYRPPAFIEIDLDDA